MLISFIRFRLTCYVLDFQAVLTMGSTLVLFFFGGYHLFIMSARFSDYFFGRLLNCRSFQFFHLSLLRYFFYEFMMMHGIPRLDARTVMRSIRSTLLSVDDNN
jgi:hypothetical protein